MFFDSAAAFRAWLQANAASADSLRVGFHKVGSSRPSMTWPESVDEALCFGWIDGVRRRIDDERYEIRFTPRRAGSIWSEVNIRKAQAQIAAGRMTPAGLAAFEAREARRSGVYSFERRTEPELGADELRAFRRQRSAWHWFEAVAPSYRRAILHWVVSAKKPETRARRLDTLIAACAEQRRLLK
jgi:uncharacterized protein YdeI (YjbR/CyaY-like superfamily)